MAEKLGTLAGHFVIVPIADGETAEILSDAIASLPDLIEAAEQALDVLSAEAIGTHNPENQEWYESVCKAGDALREALSSIKGGK